MNANLIFKWRRDPLYAPDPAAAPCLSEGSRFLPVEMVAETMKPPAAPVADNQIEIALAGGHRMRISGGYDPEVPSPASATTRSPRSMTCSHGTGTASGQAGRLHHCRKAMTRPAFAAWLSDTNDVTLIFLSAGQTPGLINMAGGLPDPVTWPIPDLAELARASVANHPCDALAYAPIDGHPALRDMIAARFSAPGLGLIRENVLITAGGMQALDLLGRVLVDDGQVIAAQSPAYPGALDAWKPRRPTYRPMRLEGNDFAPELAFQGAQFAYTVPNFSNPTGRLVGLAPSIGGSGTGNRHLADRR